MSSESPQPAKKIFTSTRAVFFAAWVCLPAWVFDPRELPAVISILWATFIVIVLIEAFILWRREIQDKRAANRDPNN